MSSIRPTFTGFETAKTGIFINQKALDIVGNNLASADVTGYTRQRVDTASIYLSTAASRVASNTVGLQGQGVEALGVSQMRDATLDTRFRNAYSSTSYHSEASKILTDLQTALGDGNDLTDESGLHGALKQIYNALNDYMQTPTLDSSANVVMSAFKNATQVIRQMSAQLTNVQKDETADLGTTVERVNKISLQIAELNETISNDSIVSTSDGNEYFRPNELLDQRNLLLDELAGYGEISVITSEDGTVDVTLGGHALVKGNVSNTLQMVENGDDTVSVQWTDSSAELGTTTGSIRAACDFLNGRGPNMQKSTETSERGALYYRDCLDTFANALASAANNTIPEVDSSGEPIKDANGNVVYKTLLASENGNSHTVSSSDIALSKEWTQSGAGYFICSRTENITQYAQQLNSLLTDESSTFQSYGETYYGSFADFEVNFLSRLGSDLSYQSGREEATSAIANDLQDSRDAISGVNRDEETADMLQYQKAYQAAARLMTTLDDMLDVLINRMGRVGL